MVIYDIISFPKYLYQLHPTCTCNNYGVPLIGLKTVFKMSALCGEYISQRIYKHNEYIDLFVNTMQHLELYVDVFISTLMY